MSNINHESKLLIRFTSKSIRTRVNQIGKDLSKEYKNKNPLFIGVLNGSFMFFSDLMRSLTIDCEIDFIQLKSYDGKNSTGKVVVLKDFSISLKNRHIILVEDIIETGKTLDFLLKKIEGFSPKSISIVTLLVKNRDRSYTFNIDYIGFEISREFVVGYGLDLDQRFRQLDCLYKLKPESTT